MKLRTKEREIEIKIEDAVITVRSLPFSKLIELKEKFTEIHNDKEKVNEHKLTKAFFCEMVKDWQGIYDEEGNPLPCTEETKQIVWDFNPFFADELLRQADEKFKALREAEPGNLGNGVSGSSQKAG